VRGGRPFVADGDTDCDRLGRQIEKSLSGLGLEQPKVTVRLVSALDRHSATGKLRRFVPLSP
jgi:hypothetical protein